MKRLLCIVGSMNAGGAETFLMKIYRCLDKSKYQMDFAVTSNGVYDDEIKSLGGKIHYITPKTKGFIKNIKDIYNLIKKEKYNYVLRSSQHSLSALELLIAKFAGAKVRVFRSSNTNACAGRINSLIHKICLFMPRCFANVKLAPSTEAAKFMFGEDSVKKGRAHVLHNALDHNKFKFNASAREEIRNEFDFSDKFVIGHIGRFNHQKNHKFLIDVFCDIKKIKSNSMLVLIGKGELETSIKDYVKSKGIESDVKFMGIRQDVEKFLSAFDVMIFPSLFEGMPNTIIEAQAAGLPCLISDTITPEAEITELVKYKSINLPSSEWAKDALKIVVENRIDTRKCFENERYLINDIANEFVNLIF